LETGAKQGMCLMDNYLLALWEDGTISEETALAYIRDRSVRHRIESRKQLGDVSAQIVQTALPGDDKQKKKWGFFR
ncbi:MAG: hypothetical protein D6820_07810, partial [Lentisphaerae bacterium]